MTAAQNEDDTAPSITGTANQGATGQAKSYRTLVILHALLLGVPFVVLFPLGVVGLRFRWFRGFLAHWIIQSISSAGALVGLALAVAMSITGIEYDNFSEPHQLLGICVVALVALQAAAGYLHHQKFKQIKSRTSISHVHIWLGRIVIYGGMINAML